MRLITLFLFIFSLSACTIGVNLDAQDSANNCGENCTAQIDVFIDPSQSVEEKVAQYDLQGFAFNFYQSVGDITTSQLRNNNYSVPEGKQFGVSRCGIPHYTLTYHLDEKSLEIPGTVFGESHANARITYTLHDESNAVLLTHTEECAFSDEMNGGETTSHFLMPFDSLTARSFSAFLARVWTTTATQCSEQFIQKIETWQATSHLVVSQP